MNEAEQRAILEAAADQLSPEMRQAFLEAVARARDRLDVEALARALRERDFRGALDILQAAADPNDFARLQGAIDLGVMRGGAAAAEIANAAAFVARAGFEVRFQVMNPATADFIQSYSVPLVREITADIHAAIQQEMADGLKAGTNPNDIARSVRASIGLTARQQRAVQNFRRLASSSQPADIREALSRALRDKRFDRSLLAAANGSRPMKPEKIDAMVAAYQRRYLRHRSENIARTEARRATAVGADELWRQQVASGRFRPDQIVKKWHYTSDSRTRHAHRTLPGLNPPDGLPLLARFSSMLGPISYPGDPEAAAGNTINCRCWITYRIRP